MARPVKGRTQGCSEVQARARLRQASAFMEVAELVAGDEVAATEDLNYDHVAAALLVLAAIAAADAVCCATMGQRSRGPDHRRAVELLRQARFGTGTSKEREARAKDLAKGLGRVLDLKDTAHYGMIFVHPDEVRTTIRHVRALLAGARDAVAE